MIGNVNRKGHATTSVFVHDIPASARDEDILTAALSVARETKSSLFGWEVSRDAEDRTAATVRLHTD